MSYKIFISHSSEDKSLAEVIMNVINDAFAGAIELFLATKSLKGGLPWKKIIKENLEKCDAIISIITSQSISKPWVYVEWSPFWLSEKPYFILLTKDIKVSDLIEPMRDLQAINIENIESIKGFFETLKHVSGVNRIPFEYVPKLMQSAHTAHNDAIKERDEAEFGIYRNFKRLDSLPASENEKEKIAEYFFSKGEYNVFLKILEKIRNNSIKAELALKALDAGHLDITYKAANLVRSSEYLSYIIYEMISQGYDDTKEVRDLLENISIKSQDTLGKVAIEIIDNNRWDSELFRYICELMTNMAEFRKVMVHLIHNNIVNDLIFTDLLRKFEETNRAELRKVAIEMINCGYQKTKSFETSLDILFRKSTPHAFQVMEHLHGKDKESFFERLQNIKQHETGFSDIIKKLQLLADK